MVFVRGLARDGRLNPMKQRQTMDNFNQKLSKCDASTNLECRPTSLQISAARTFDPACQEKPGSAARDLGKSRSDGHVGSSRLKTQTSGRYPRGSGPIEGNYIQQSSIVKLILVRRAISRPFRF